VFIHKNKFTTNDHHRPLTVKSEYVKFIDLYYSRQVIETALLNQGFKWSKTASKEKVAKIKVPFPVDDNGKINIEKQKEISEKYQKIAQVKSTINKHLKEIEKMVISYD